MSELLNDSGQESADRTMAVGFIKTILKHIDVSAAAAGYGGPWLLPEESTTLARKERQS